MIGSIVTASVIEFAHNKHGELRGVIVELPDNAKGFLHIGRMLGKTDETRAGTLNALVAGTPVEVEIIGETVIDDAPGFKVSQWSVVRRRLNERAATLMAEKTVINAIVIRVAPDYAIVDLGEGLQGLLHITRVAGNSDEEKTARFQTITVGDTIPVVLSAEPRPGRVRVSEVVV